MIPPTQLPEELLRAIDAIASKPGIPLDQRDAVRDELIAHFEDRLADSPGLIATTQIAKLADEFGNTECIAALIARAAQRRAGGSSMRLMGFFLFVALIAVVIFMGSSVWVFINLPAFIAVIGLSIAMGLTAWGPRKLLTIHGAVATTLFPGLTNEVSPDCAPLIRGHISQVYAAGAIATLLGFVQMLASLDDVSQIGGALALITLALFYSTCIAEGLLRPVLRHVEYVTVVAK